MSKQRYILAIALLLAALTLAACGGSATPEAGAAENVPASNTTAGVTAEATDAAAAGASGRNGACGTNGRHTGGSRGCSGNGSRRYKFRNRGIRHQRSAAGTTSARAVRRPAPAMLPGPTPPAMPPQPPMLVQAVTAQQAPAAAMAPAARRPPDGDTGSTVEDSTTTSTESGTGGTGDTGAEGSTASGAGAYTAVSDAGCTEIQGQLNTALGVEFTRTTGVAAFSDLSGGTGESCQLTVSRHAVHRYGGDGEPLIRQTLSDNGWTVDEQYAADGPTTRSAGCATTTNWRPTASIGRRSGNQLPGRLRQSAPALKP